MGVGGDPWRSTVTGDQREPWGAPAPPPASPDPYGPSPASPYANPYGAAPSGPYAGPYAPPTGPPVGPPVAPPVGPTLGPPAWADPGGQRDGSQPRVIIGLAIALLAIVLLAVGTAVIVGPKEDSSSRFEKVGGRTTDSRSDRTPANGTFVPSETHGNGDLSYFRPVMPSAEEVDQAMGPAEQLELRTEVADAAGPAASMCASVDAEVVASHHQVWVDDEPDSPWELQASVLDFGTSEAAEGAIAARQTDPFRECLAQGVETSTMDTISGEVLEHAERPRTGKAGASEAILLSGYYMIGCGKDDGRMAMVWRQVDRYTISAKAYGCRGVDLKTVDPILDQMEARLG